MQFGTTPLWWNPGSLAIFFAPGSVASSQLRLSFLFNLLHRDKLRSNFYPGADHVKRRVLVVQQMYGVLGLWSQPHYDVARNVNAKFQKHVSETMFPQS